ncbi:hypothetical protein BCPG_04719 [Burkholderia cenocepacia PC184]|nr:hypothetical protein BCPG_04719 [Burkholderia cenocepacia PC184]
MLVLLRRIVPAAQAQRVLRERAPQERHRLLFAEDAALQPQTAHRVRRQALEVAGIRAAQAALRVDMQPDRLQHRMGKQRPQERQHVVLMQIVDPARARRVALAVQQMAEVMQERRRDQRFVRPGLLRQQSALQCMFELRDRFAAIGHMSMLAIQPVDLFHRQRHPFTPKAAKTSSGS